MKYQVQIPFAGVLSACVEAGSKREALAKAFALDWSMKLWGPDVDALVIDEIEIYKQMHLGNMCRAPLHEAYAEEA